MKEVQVYKIIEKHHGTVPKGVLTFYLWLRSKYPAGVAQRCIHYPFLSPRMLIRTLNQLQDNDMIEWENKRSSNAKITIL